ncbi:MAG: phosphatidate cytidylyltransferase [Bacteroidetes bacterium]|nr:phosphatidate cytidylyltransferase [Bacteroidota bacterium]
MNRNLQQRLLTALVGGTLFLGMLWYSYGTLVALVSLLLVGCCWEWARMRPGSWLIPGFVLILAGWCSMVWIARPAPEWSPYPAMAPLLLVWTQDTFAFFGGKLLGRHKLWPSVSPGKTWEGMLVGLVFTTALAVWLGAYPLWKLPRPAWAAGLLMGLVAVGGDLLESAAKRRAGVKDSGNLLPGHGGLLDRFDALLPVLAVYAAWVSISGL